MATIAEDTLTAILAAINNPDPAPLEAFVAAHYADPARVAPLWARFRRTSGPVRLISVEPSGPNAVNAVIEDGWEYWRYNFPLTVAAEAPHLVQPAGLTIAARPPEAMPTRRPWPEVLEALKARLAASIAEDRISGAIKVVRHGETLFETAYGLADREAGTPNTLETRFRMGSMNKMITGVAVLQLAGAGRLGLDDPVGRHLPDYPNRTFAEDVTVRHLLNHTGGAGDFFGPEFREHRLQLHDPKDFVALLGGREPEFAPGAQYKYANYGFIVLGRIVEAVTRESYDAYVARHIYEVAGMTRSGALPEETPLEGRAVGYMDDPNGLVRNDETLPYRGTPAGGGYSTVGDLVRFGEALTGGRLLSPDAMRPIGAGGVFVSPPNVSYGAGFQEMQWIGSDPRTLGHSGGAPGMNGALIIHPDSGYVIAALSNGDPPQADSQALFVSRLLLA